MKLALRYIPTEVWVDVVIFPWITRKELGKIVHRFRNRKFVEILQYCLHERGKRTLDRLILYKQALSAIPRTQMPENIKFFERITIWYFDALALDFLRRVSTLFICNHVNLDLFCLDRDVLANLRTVLEHLSPLIHGIHSMAFDQLAIPIVEQYFGPKLAKTKMLSINLSHPTNQAATIQMGIDFCVNWLTSEERDRAEPRLLEIYAYWNDFKQFCTAVQQQFLSAKRPCTFAIEHPRHGHYRFFDLNFHLDLQNSLGEQLHGEINENGYNFQIFRHPGNFARTQLQEWVGQTDIKCYASSVIELGGELTIGPFDANTAENGVDGAGEEEDGPSSSKQQ